MWRETNILGVYMSPLVAYMVAALLLYMLLRVVLLQLRLLRWTWNTPLAEAGLYVCILGILLVWF